MAVVSLNHLPVCIEMEAVYNALKPEFEGEIAFINIDVNDPAEQELCAQYNLRR